jgi:hypothetical protein
MMVCYRIDLLGEPMTIDTTPRDLRESVLGARQTMNENNQREVDIRRSGLQRPYIEAGRLFPSREAMLEAMPKCGIVAEVGVAGGNLQRRY